MDIHAQMNNAKMRKGKDDKGLDERHHQSA